MAIGFEDAAIVGIGDDLAGPGEGGEWRIHGDFFLARADDSGGLADLTEADVRRWTLRLVRDRILRS